jgi:valyl-tRNA synthetase
LHPFIPFITEEIWQGLRLRQSGQSLVTEQQPRFNGSADPDVLLNMELLFEVITQVRAIRQQHGIGSKLPLTLYVSGTEQIQWNSELEPLLFHLAFIERVETGQAPPREVFSFQVKQWTCSIPAEGFIDTKAEMERIEKEQEYLLGFIESVRKKLSNERFVANAKPEVVAIERQKEADAQAKLEALEKQLKDWRKE